MKRIATILILFCVLLSITACRNSNLNSENDVEEYQEANFEAEQVIEKENESETNEDVIVPNEASVTEVVYEDVRPCYDNRILVKQAGRWGMIDNLGNVIMPITQSYSRIYRLNTNAVVFVKNDNVGVLSLSGEVLVPAMYDGVNAINEDLIYLEDKPVYKENGERYISGEEIYKTTNKFYSVKNKKYLNLEIIGYLSIVAVGQNFFVIDYSSEYEKGIMKIITFDGEMIDIDPISRDWDVAQEQRYAGISAVRDVYISYDIINIYKTSNGDEYIVSYKHILDSEGNTVIDFTDKNCHIIFNNNYYPSVCCSDEVIIAEFVREDEEIEGLFYWNHYVYNLISHEKKKIETIDDNTTITQVLNNNFYEIEVLDKYNVIRYRYAEYFGIMNDKYEIVVEPIYDSVDDYVNGYCPIELNEYIGFVDEAGNVFAPQFSKKNIVDDDKFTYLYNPPYGRGSLIDPRTGEILPYEEADLKDDYGFFEAILTDADTGAKYKSFVTWDGPIVEHKFPNTKISMSSDGKVAVYNKGTLYTIVELQ